LRRVTFAVVELEPDAEYAAKLAVMLCVLDGQ
jgi:hypothetical protein